MTADSIISSIKSPSSNMLSSNGAKDQAKPQLELEPTSEYERWVARLYETPFFHPINNGLANITRLHALLGNPMDNVSWEQTFFGSLRFYGAYNANLSSFDAYHVCIFFF